MRPRKLLGTYRTPPFRYGATVHDLIYGNVVIVGLSDGRIPWPLGRKRGARGKASLVLFRDLVQAIQYEAEVTVCYWWGVCPDTVWKWRRALGVDRVNEGTHSLLSAHGKSPGGRKALKAMRKKARDPERREKIAAAKRGKPRPRHVLAALRRARKGKTIPIAARRKMIEAHRKRGTRPPWLNPAWSPAEYKLLRTLPPTEVAKRTGRTLAAVYSQRSLLGLNACRTERHRR